MKVVQWDRVHELGFSGIMIARSGQKQISSCFEPVKLDSLSRLMQMRWVSKLLLSNESSSTDQNGGIPWKRNRHAGMSEWVSQSIPSKWEWIREDFGQCRATSITQLHASLVTLNSLLTTTHYIRFWAIAFGTISSFCLSMGHDSLSICWHKRKQSHQDSSSDAGRSHNIKACIVLPFYYSRLFPILWSYACVAPMMHGLLILHSRRPVKHLVLP